MDLQQSVDLQHLCSFADPSDGEDREASLGLDPKGFFIRQPPTPHQLASFITADDQLFQIIHMGAALIDTDCYSIVVDGLVECPFILSLAQLKFPSNTLTTFHECYGSPSKPPTENTWRIRNVQMDWSSFTNVARYRLTTGRSSIRLVRGTGLRRVCRGRGRPVSERSSDRKSPISKRHACTPNKWTIYLHK
jgi:DMSO/TMAO reductase YedYZ molybdopterin-dependent catalytic subunit